jgi:plastocyanin
MKTKLLFTLLFLTGANLIAQTETINITWHFGSNPNDATEGQLNYPNKTIEVGDTVIWNWTASTTHTVTRIGGSSSDSFNSGSMSGVGTTFSKTFTTTGTNDYICNPHPGNMFGTITVVPDGSLGVDEFNLSELNISPNPVTTEFKVDLPNSIESANIDVFDILGKQIYSMVITSFNSVVEVSNWDNGTYLVRVSSGEYSQTKRIIKQ